MITNTFLRCRNLEGKSRGNGQSKYERMAYHEYLVMRGVSMDNIDRKLTLSLHSPNLKVGNSVGLELCNQVDSNLDFKLVKFRDEDDKVHWTDELLSDVEYGVNVVNGNQLRDVSLL